VRRHDEQLVPAPAQGGQQVDRKGLRAADIRPEQLRPEENTPDRARLALLDEAAKLARVGDAVDMEPPACTVP
jgi:hypothetical protein